VRRGLRRLAIAAASLIALLVVAAAIFMAVFDVHVGRGIGDRRYVVTSAQELHDDYRLGIGSLELDLSKLQLPVGETRVETSVDVGDLQVILPADAALRGYGEARAGRVELLGNDDDGWNADIELTEPGKRVLVLVAHVGAGSVRVERAVR
jgi:predicted membrane protein